MEDCLEEIDGPAYDMHLQPATPATYLLLTLL